MHWQVLDLGTLAYGPALALQRQRLEAVADRHAPEALLLVEHEPVITLTPRPSARQHLLATPDVLRQRGIALAETDRGGDITYHGPGQLVAYPILHLADHHLNLSRYMRLLERAVIATLATFDVIGHAEAGATGVWVGSEPTAKVCAMGVRIRRQVTMHGLALNVTTNLDDFACIDPCGLGGRPVTSLQQLLGERCPTMGEVKAALTVALAMQINAATSAGAPKPRDGHAPALSASPPEAARV